MNQLKSLFLTAKNLMNKHTELVFITIIASSGSSPRGAGSRMLVLADGTSYGSIGGGSLEYTAMSQATALFREKTSFIKNYHLNKNETADLGMICGGDVTVYFQYISGNHTGFSDLCSVILSQWDYNKSCWLLLDITDEATWDAGIYSSARGLIGLNLPDISPLLKRKALQSELHGRIYYTEPLFLAEKVYIFGGGHVAMELIPLLSHLDFQCVVFDDRPEFSSPDRFPDACQCITGDFDRVSDYLAILPEDYVCIMTRGHQYDYLLQKQLLMTSAAYIGVMGSRSKINATIEKLLADGYSREQIGRIKSPIGLPILAETPAEIAVSIAGELIRIRAGRDTN